MVCVGEILSWTEAELQPPKREISSVKVTAGRGFPGIVVLGFFSSKFHLLDEVVE